MEHKRVTMIATLGFGIDFIVRRLADIPKDKETVDQIVTVGLYTDPTTWQRIEQTYAILTTFLKSQNIDSRLERIDSNRGPLVKQAREIIAKTLSGDPNHIVELYLTGGPRILLASFYTAALTLGQDWSRKTRIAVYGEGFPASIVVETSKILALTRLDETSRRILAYVRDGYNDINSLLSQTGLPRSTLYKKLKELERLDLIIRSERGKYKVHPALDQIL